MGRGGRIIRMGDVQNFKIMGRRDKNIKIMGEVDKISTATITELTKAPMGSGKIRIMRQGAEITTPVTKGEPLATKITRKKLQIPILDLQI